jgi:hypothetical protein
MEFLNTTRRDEGPLSTRNDPGGVLLMRIYRMLLIAMLMLVLTGLFPHRSLNNI